ncbi:MAG: hypothetical protein BGO61_00235 [Thiobacillus sp. 65-69]|nr:hypothetical protein [Thiobacillus sp.]ODU89172.1 MAG: hypothetical protein ABT21_09465 [Thiobacillus sp. SCN 65-179]OJW34485.1 MAG: hypothetical protein BGO61_00235 [Thiobacillus sp. 65-69]
MSGAPMNRNPKKLRPGSNVDRPGGARVGANSRDAGELLRLALTGNRATRRLAKRNLRKHLLASLPG